MLINDITILEKKNKQWKAKSKKPTLNKPTTGHESPHPGRGLLVGEAPEDNVIQGKFPNHRVPKQQEFDFGPEFARENDARWEVWGKIKLPAERFEAWTLFGRFNSEAKAFDKLKRIIKPVQQGVNPFAPEKMKVVKFSIKEPKTMDFNVVKQAIAKKRAVLLPVPELGVTDNLNEAKYVAKKAELISAVLSELKNKANEEEGIKLLKRLANIVGKKIVTRNNNTLSLESKIPFNKCPKCGDTIFHESEGKKDACYHKVKSRYKVWPSAYASGALVQCRKKGAKNWGNKSKKKK